MSTEVQQILNAVRSLSETQRRELIAALEHDSLISKEDLRASAVRRIRGKYSHVPTSVDGFLERKLQDLDLE